jgi:hypothetical protein
MYFIDHIIAQICIVKQADSYEKCQIHIEITGDVYIIVHERKDRGCSSKKQPIVSQMEEKT